MIGIRHVTLGFFSVLVLLYAYFPSYASGYLLENLDPVLDLLPTKEGIYFFEQDTSLQSPTWIPNTRLMFFDGNQTRVASNDYFLFPSEILNHDKKIYFAVLSDDCIGQTICDYQNIIAVSKLDGTRQVVVKDLKSAIHLAIADNFLYVSESNGNIWKMNLDGALKKKLASSEQIIVMDMTVSQDIVYWIEEIADLENRIMAIPSENAMPIKVIDNLMIPYNLKSHSNSMSWAEIQIKSTPSGSIGEFTLIRVLENSTLREVGEFLNTSPASVHGRSPHYGPFLVYDNFLFIVNNTENIPKIHLHNFKEDMKYDIPFDSDYKIRYLRADANHLYLVGTQDDRFAIESILLPITIPEFPLGMFTIIFAATLGLAVFFKKSNFQRLQRFQF